MVAVAFDRDKLFMSYKNEHAPAKCDEVTLIMCKKVDPMYSSKRIPYSVTRYLIVTVSDKSVQAVYDRPECPGLMIKIQGREI